MKPNLRLGTRGSPLARAQAKMILDGLIRSRPNLSPEIHIIRTSGDQWSATPGPAGMPVDKGMFTKELEEALLVDQIDVAVHSLKDLPVDFHPDLELAAITPRVDPRDVLVTREPFHGWEQLPKQATIATGSLRRSEQLRTIRSDLQTADIRGNIDTRLRKLRENPGWHGLVLAAAGLERLVPELTGLHVTAIDTDQMLPAPGQGAIALQGKVTNVVASTAVFCLHCFDTYNCVVAERAFLKALGGGCRTPVGAYATLQGSRLRLKGVCFPAPGQPGIRGEVEGSDQDPEGLGCRLAAELMRT